MIGWTESILVESPAFRFGLGAKVNHQVSIAGFGERVESASNERRKIKIDPTRFVGCREADDTFDSQRAVGEQVVSKQIAFAHLDDDVVEERGS